MRQFKIVPLSEEYARKLRERQKEDFGHGIVEQVATGKWFYSFSQVRLNTLLFCIFQLYKIPPKSRREGKHDIFWHHICKNGVATLINPVL
jgi:hypothetical protein